MSALVKSVLLVLAAISFRIAVNPPNPPPTKNDRLYHPKTLFEGTFRWLCVLIQACICSVYYLPSSVNIASQVVGIGCLMTECAMLLALHVPFPQASRMLSTVCASPSPSLTNLSTISPLFMLGVGMMYISGMLRLWCYKTLGSLFTFELAIRHNHKLITSGPYAIVRHPGYTGALIINTSVIIPIFCAGSYVYECRIMSTLVGGILVVWVAVLGYAIVALLGRGKIEDEELRKEFGGSWDSYSRSVPYRFVPGLI